jgi:glutathione S-transferase
MIDLYDWPTPNGHKVAIFLEETGLEYRIAPINIRKGEQFAHGRRPDVRPSRPLLASGS